MDWKKLPYWLRGGIIASSIGLIFFIVEMSLPVQPKFSEYFANIYSIPALPLIFIVSFVVRLPFNPYLIIVFSFLMHVISYFIAGSLIGLIYGKIKSKR